MIATILPSLTELIEPLVRRTERIAPDWGPTRLRHVSAWQAEDCRGPYEPCESGSCVLRGSHRASLTGPSLRTAATAWRLVREMLTNERWIELSLTGFTVVDTSAGGFLVDVAGAAVSPIDHPGQHAPVHLYRFARQADCPLDDLAITLHAALLDPENYIRAFDNHLVEHHAPGASRRQVVEISTDEWDPPKFRERQERFGPLVASVLIYLDLLTWIAEKLGSDDTSRLLRDPVNAAINQAGL